MLPEQWVASMAKLAWCRVIGFARTDKMIIMTEEKIERSDKELPCIQEKLSLVVGPPFAYRANW